MASHLVLQLMTTITFRSVSQRFKEYQQERKVRSLLSDVQELKDDDSDSEKRDKAFVLVYDKCGNLYASKPVLTNKQHAIRAR